MESKNKYTVMTTVETAKGDYYIVLRTDGERKRAYGVTQNIGAIEFCPVWYYVIDDAYLSIIDAMR